LWAAFFDKPILIFPGSSGGSAWAPLAYSPKTKLVYIPANVIPTVPNGYPLPVLWHTTSVPMGPSFPMRISAGARGTVCPT
jgi:hypothetical protein